MDDTDYAFGRTHAEYARLIEQAELFRPLTERMLIAAGIKRGMHVLDVGCGVGDVSFLVAALVGPEGSVVGVDLDAEVLKLAEERRAAKRITNETSRRRHVCCLISGNGLDHQRRLCLCWRFATNAEAVSAKSCCAAARELRSFIANAPTATRCIERPARTISRPPIRTVLRRT